MGADQRLARRDRQPGEDPASRRARPLLHRKLVGAVRLVHSGDDAAGAGQDRERLLMPRPDPAVAPAASGPARSDARPASPAGDKPRYLVSATKTPFQSDGGATSLKACTRAR